MKLKIKIWILWLKNWEEKIVFVVNLSDWDFICFFNEVFSGCKNFIGYYIIGFNKGLGFSIVFDNGWKSLKWKYKVLFIGYKYGGLRVF